MPASVYAVRGGVSHGTRPLGTATTSTRVRQTGMGLFCEIFVTTDLATDALERLIAASCSSAIERQDAATTVVGPGYEIDVRRNERVLARADQHVHDFVAWPYYPEFEATAEQSRHTQIAVIARLLTGLWE